MISLFRFVVTKIILLFFFVFFLLRWFLTNLHRFPQISGDPPIYPRRKIRESLRINWAPKFSLGIPSFWEKLQGSPPWFGWFQPGWNLQGKSQNHKIHPLIVFGALLTFPWEIHQKLTPTSKSKISKRHIRVASRNENTSKNAGKSTIELDHKSPYHVLSYLSCWWNWHKKTANTLVIFGGDMDLKPAFYGDKMRQKNGIVLDESATWPKIQLNVGFIS